MHIHSRSRVVKMQRLRTWKMKTFWPRNSEWMPLIYEQHKAHVISRSFPNSKTGLENTSMWVYLYPIIILVPLSFLPFFLKNKKFVCIYSLSMNTLDSLHSYTRMWFLQWWVYCGIHSLIVCPSFDVKYSTCENCATSIYDIQSRSKLHLSIACLNV